MTSENTMETVEEHFELIGESLLVDKNRTLITNTYNAWIGDAWSSAICSHKISFNTKENKVYIAKFEVVSKNTSISSINIGIQ